MKTSLRSFAAAIAFAFAAVLPAAAQPAGDIVDASLPMADAMSSGAFGDLATHWPLYGVVRIAQTLTVEVGGNLQGVFLPVFTCSSGGPVVVEVVEVVAGLPSANRLDAVGVPAKLFDLGGPGRFVYVPFSASVALARGQQVAIVLGYPRGYCWISAPPSGMTYAGGEGFGEYWNLGWMRLPYGGYRSEDLPFQLVLHP